MSFDIKIDISDFHEICRTCLLKKESMKLIHRSEAPKMLGAITAVQIDCNDGLPSLICLDCLTLLNDLFNFKQQCEFNNQLLRNILAESFQNSFSPNNDNSDSDTVIKFEQKSDENSVVIEDCKNNVLDFKVDISRQTENITKTKLKSRKQSSKSQTPHSCSICGRSFEVAWKLTKHKRLHSTERFLCNICHDSFKYPFYLKKHMEIKHSGPRKKDVCNICGASVVQIKAHMLQKHSDYRPFKCTECEAAYVTKTKLSTHVATKHKGEKILNHLCSFCGKCSPSATALRVHVRTHTQERPFACETCGKSYTTAHDRRIHMRSHTGERPYVCSVCNKGFSTSQLRKVHVRIHTDERPYSCKICERTFRQRCALKAHMKIH